MAMSSSHSRCTKLLCREHSVSRARLIWLSVNSSMSTPWYLPCLIREVERDDPVAIVSDALAEHRGLRGDDGDHVELAEHPVEGLVAILRRHVARRQRADQARDHHVTRERQARRQGLREPATVRVPAGFWDGGEAEQVGDVEAEAG